MSLFTWVADKIIDYGSRHDADGPLYKPLSRHEDQIRLLYIKAANPDDELSFWMSREPIHRMTAASGSHYMALSYVWGDLTDTETIHINRHAVEVTKNLAGALRYFRQWMKTTFPTIEGKSPVMRLWIDRLCIDQENPVEKSYQVKLMSVIYSEAQLVLAWMGKDDETATTFSDIELIGDQIIKHDAMTDDLLSWLKHCPHLCKRDESRISQVSPTGNTTWDRVHIMSSNEYWTRTWILQEVILAKTVFFLCQNTVLKPAHLDALHLWQKRLVEEKPACPSWMDKHVWMSLIHEEHWGLFNKFSEIWRLRRNRSLRGDDRPLNLAELGSFSIGFRATEPKDKIYGLLSLTTSTIPVDYRKSVGEVYKDHFQDVLENCRSLTLLQDAGVGLFRNGSNPFGLPSWCPDWHELTTRFWKEIPETHINLRESISNDINTLDVQASISGNILKSDGFTFDQVEKIEEQIDDWLSFGLYIFKAGSVNKYEDFYLDHIKVSRTLSDIFKIITTISATSEESAEVMVVAFIAWLANIVREGTQAEQGETLTPEQLVQRTLMALGVFDDWAFGKSVSHRFFADGWTPPPAWEHKPATDILLSKEYRVLFAVDPYSTSRKEAYAMQSGTDFRCNQAMNKIISATHSIATNRLFFTKGGYMGFGPFGIREGDRAIMLLGFSYPLTTRRVGNGNQYVVVGVCQMPQLPAMLLLQNYEAGSYHVEGFEFR